MMYCSKCKVNVAGKREFCPLCQATLENAGLEGEEVFPYIKSRSKSGFNLFFKILMLISFVSIIVAGTINLITSDRVNWSLYVAAGFGSGWLILIAVLLKRKNILKTIVYQMIIIAGLCVLWDFATGVHRWSVNFAIPIIVTCAMIISFIVVKILKIKREEYGVYLFAILLFNIIPIVLIAMNIITIRIPSIICVATSVVIFIYFILFNLEYIVAEFKRRLHV